jgi:hypothetical protein
MGEIENAIQGLESLLKSLPCSEEELKSVIRKKIDKDLVNRIPQGEYDRIIKDIYPEFSKFLESQREEILHQIASLKELKEKYP